MRGVDPAAAFAGPGLTAAAEAAADSAVDSAGSEAGAAEVSAGLVFGDADGPRPVPQAFPLRAALRDGPGPHHDVHAALALHETPHAPARGGSNNKARSRTGAVHGGGAFGGGGGASADADCAGGTGGGGGGGGEAGADPAVHTLHTGPEPAPRGKAGRSGLAPPESDGKDRGRARTEGEAGAGEGGCGWCGLRGVLQRLF